MASVKRRRDSKYWVACITLPSGKQKQFSTGLVDREEALGVAVAAERAGRMHANSPHQLRQALDRIAEDFTPPDALDPGEWLVAWVDSKRGTITDKSRLAYQAAMVDARAWLHSEGLRTFAAVTEVQVVRLREFWAGRHAATTANGKLKMLRIALAAAVRARLLPHNPAASVTRLKERKTARREFRPAELETLLAHVTGEWRALVLLGLWTGQRLNDLAELRWQNVDMAAKTIHFTARKTGALVSLPLTDPAVDALLALSAGDKPDAAMFPGIAALPAPSRSNAFREILAQAGLAPAKKHVGLGKTRREILPLSFHSLRHTATSMLKAAGVSDAIARAIIGHESAAVSRQYTHFDMATMRQALEKITQP